LPSVPLRCPGFPKSSDFIALDCPQFGNKIGDSCPELPSVAHRIGDRIGDAVRVPFRPVCVQASQHEGFIFGQEWLESQSAFYARSHTVTSCTRESGLGRLRAPCVQLTLRSAFMIYWDSEYIYASFEMGQ